MRYDRFAVAIVTGVVFLALLGFSLFVFVWPQNTGSATPYEQEQTIVQTAEPHE